MKYFYLLLLLISTSICNAQLKPGFDPHEYLELLSIARQQTNDTVKGEHIPAPKQFKMVYRSPEGPLKNRWDLWYNNKGIAVICIRGTTRSETSWLENFYAAMVPASGKLHINDSTNFKYHLASNPRAGIHVGWLLGMADLTQTILPKLFWLNQAKGVKNFIIMGHSQGAAIAALLRSHFADLQSKRLLPADLVFKTYCSAPPKPGNVYYSYDFNYLTRGGWCISVTNAADWVPQTPSSIQTMDNFSTTNPFTKADATTKKQSFFKWLYPNHVYNQLKKKPEKAQQANQKYLGNMAYTRVKKQLPQFTEPKYLSDNSYASCGTPIILMPDKDYQSKFPDDPHNAYVHHTCWSYYYLTQKEYLNQ